MLFCDTAVVLWRRGLRENDRIVSLYTRESGRLEVNFKGVRLSSAKLRALSEPVSWGEYRFYLRRGSNFPVCTGGRTLSVFPSLRSHPSALFLALHFCEMVWRLTPLAQPNPDKYELLLSAFRALESEGPSPWMKTAFSLRFMESAGFGLRDTAAGVDSALWSALHSGSWREVSGLKAEPEAVSYVEGLVSRFVRDHLNADLRTEDFI